MRSIGSLSVTGALMLDGHETNGRRSRGKRASDQEVRESILAEIATLYYVDRLSQEQIARQISRSVSTVSRLLNKAKESEIVEVRVRDPVPVVPELQTALVQRFGLRLARVLRTPPGGPQQLLPQLGNLAARYLTILLADNVVISVGWGRSLYEVIRAVNPGRHRGIRVAQALGSLGSRQPEIDNYLMTRLLAERVNGTPHFLPAPMIVESQHVRDTLATDSQLRETLDLGRRSDIALLGIGMADPEHSGVYRAGYIDSEALKRIQRSGAIGDIMVEFFDVYGRIHETEMSARVMGMRLADLRQVPSIVVVAGGIAKAPAILGALRTGVIHVLVTDDATARCILKAADASSEPRTAPEVAPGMVDCASERTVSAP